MPGTERQTFDDDQVDGPADGRIRRTAGPEQPCLPEMPDLLGERTAHQHQVAPGMGGGDRLEQVVALVGESPPGGHQDRHGCGLQPAMTAATAMSLTVMFFPVGPIS